ncbi:DNA-binding protein [Bacillus sp. AFS017336]|nr:DNA-binding protein [Bacillus sp. AFS017336]
MNKTTMTVKELSAYIGVGMTTIYQEVSEGKIPHVRVRSKILFSKEVIDEWLNKK